MVKIDKLILPPDRASSHYYLEALFPTYKDTKVGMYVYTNIICIKCVYGMYMVLSTLHDQRLLGIHFVKNEG